jgi:hypothetical protein
MGHLGVVLYEYLGEEYVTLGVFNLEFFVSWFTSLYLSCARRLAMRRYPEVLGSILGALKAIVNVIGMSKARRIADMISHARFVLIPFESIDRHTQMTPPIKDLLPRLTPILRNRHEKVQEVIVERRYYATIFVRSNRNSFFPTETERCRFGWSYCRSRSITQLCQTKIIRLIIYNRTNERIGPEYVSAREWMRICLTGDHEVLVEGVGWLPLPLVTSGQRVWSLSGFGSDKADWHTVTDTVKMPLPPGDKLLRIATTRINILASQDHMHWVRKYHSKAPGGIGEWTKERSSSLGSDRWFMTAAQPAARADWEWHEPFLHEVNTDVAKQIAFCSLLGFYMGDGSIRMINVDGHPLAGAYSETQKLVVLHQSCNHPGGQAWLKTQLGVLGWLVDGAAAMQAAYAAGRVEPAFYLFGEGTPDAGYRTLHSGLYDMLWPMSDNALSLSNATPMPIRLAALDSRLRQEAPGGAGDVWLPGETEYQGLYGPAWYDVDNELSDKRPVWAELPPSFRTPRWAALRQWRAKRRARVLAAMGKTPPVMPPAPSVASLVAPPSKPHSIAGRKREREPQATMVPAPAPGRRPCALLDLVVEGEQLPQVPAALLDTAGGVAQQSVYAGLDITVDELAELKRILAMSYLPRRGEPEQETLSGQAIPPWWDWYLLRSLYYPWRLLFSVRQARAFVVGHVVADGLLAAVTADKPLTTCTAALPLRDDLAALAAIAGWPCSVGVNTFPTAAGSLNGRRIQGKVVVWNLHYHSVLDTDVLEPAASREAYTLVRKEARTWVEPSSAENVVYCLKVATGNFLTRRVVPPAPGQHASTIHQVFTGNCHELLEMLKAPKKGAYSC